MKFRGLISDQNAMKEFMNIVNSLSKLSKECVLRILPEKIYFIIADEDHGPRRPFVWCELSSVYYFREYNMAGISNDLNEIYLSFSPVMLAKSVTSIKLGAKSLKIKLTNKQTPCLTLEIDMAVNETRNRQCVHDIPVEVITKKYWNDYKEPHYEEFHVSLQLPSLRPVRNMAERMKAMSHYLTVSANRAGCVTLKIEASLVNVSAHFHNLTVHSFAEGLQHTEDSSQTYVEGDELVSVCIDVRKLVSFLAALHLVHGDVVCSIVHNTMAKLAIEHHDHHMKLQCFLTEFQL